MKVLTLICEKRYKIRKTIARPTAKLALYIAAKKINAIRIKLPKPVSNKLTKRLGTANITTHKTSNNVISPTTKLRFLREKIPLNEISIIIYIFKKKIEHKSLKTKPLYTIIHYESAEYNPLY